MPSYTSSFERDLPAQPWRLILAIVFAVFGILVVSMELQLARLGYQPTVLGAKDRWIEERFRANQLGEKALVIVGASRIQLGIDLQIFKNRTGLEPVQLALDGSSPYPILASLANDPDFNGSVIVDYYAHNIGDFDGSGESLLKAFEEKALKPFSIPTGHTVEKYLSRVLHDQLRSYSDGANPLLSLEHRIFDARPQSQYLITLPDRSRKADYRKVPLPAFYYSRVARTLGIQLDKEDNNTEAKLRRKVSEQTTIKNRSEWQNKVEETRKLVAAIQKKGGKVIFLGMPSSGMVREIEERRYPKAEYWDYFVQTIGAPAFHSNYTPDLKDFNCPDGSHLDMRDQAPFTESLVRVLMPYLYTTAGSWPTIASVRFV